MDAKILALICAGMIAGLEVLALIKGIDGTGLATIIR